MNSAATPTLTAYTVRLQDAGRITPEGREAVERRFVNALDKALGGAENVVPAMRSYEKAAETAKPSNDLKAKAKAWEDAWAKAQQAGAKDFGEAQTKSHFKIRVK